MSTTKETALSEVSRLLGRHHVSPEDRILVAFSGGADSLALLILLSELCKTESIVALYVNHRLRDEHELAREEQLNTENCTHLAVPLIIERLRPHEVQQLAKIRGNGIEEAARTLRYRILEKRRIELGFDYIATAHTADDQSETLLMRLLQGAGSYSLQGIAEYRDRIVRPILGLTRAEIEEIVRAESLQWSVDSTNTDTRYLRNSVRHTLIPVIAELFPSYRQSLQQVANRSEETMQILQPILQRVLHEAVEKTEGSVSIDIARLRRYGESVRIVTERVIYHCWMLLNDAEGRRLPYRIVNRICEMLELPKASQESICFGETEAQRYEDLFVWRKRSGALAVGYVSAVYLPCTELDGVMELVTGPTQRGAVPMEMRARIGDDTIEPPLVARSCRTGDTIDLVGGRKRVSDLYAQWHIERSQRWRIPVLEDSIGICAVLGAAFGGKDRVATRCRLSTLARNGGTLYSVTDIEG